MTMRKWIFASAALMFAAVLSAQSTPTPAPTTQTAADIPALIQALGSDSYKIRQTAEQQLVQLGLSAKPALEQAAATADSPEIRSRAAAAVRQINDSQPEAPTYVSLHFSNGNPSVVLADIVRQTKLPIAIWPEQMWSGQWGQVPSITLNFDHAAFWPAMLQFGKMANAHPGSMGNENHITLMQGIDQSTGGVLFQQGRFTFIAARIEHRRSVNLNDQSVDNADQISLTVLLDPKTRLLHYWQPRATEAVDENGASLAPKIFPQEPQPQQLWPCNWLLNTQLNLEYPEKVGKTLVHCKGVLPVSLVTETKTLRIPDLTKAVGTTVTEAGRQVQVKSFNFAKGNGQMEATITQTGKTIAQVNGLFEQIRQAKILDADGNEVESNGSGGGSDRSVDWSWNMQPENGKHPQPKLPFSLVWEVVAATKNQDVAFEFNNLPLPPK